MNKNLVKKQIEEFWKETLKDNYLISEIDLEKDIDKEKTAEMNYRISNDGYISFYGKIENEIRKNKNIVDNDNIKELSLTRIKLNQYKLMDIDISILIGEFYILFTNKKYEQQIEKDLMKLEDYKDIKVQEVLSKNVNYTLLEVDNERVEIECKNEVDYIPRITSISADDIIKHLIIETQNKKLTIIDAQGRKKHAYFPIENEEEIVLLSNREVIEDIKICSNSNQYIYFNPIQNINLNRLEVNMIHKGNSQLEYYNKEKDKWITIKKESIEICKELRLRVKISIDDEIYSIALLKNKKALHREYKKVKVIDFTNDIDIDKSGMFNIDPVKQVLEFKMGEVKKLGVDDFEVLCGDIMEHEKGIKITPRNYYSFKENQKFGIIYTKELSDIYYLEYETNNHDILFYSGFEENNRIGYLEEIILQNKKINTDKVNRLNFKIANIIFENNVVFVKKNGNKSKFIPICRNGKTNKSTNIYLNKFKSSICINNKQKYNISLDIDKFFQNREKSFKIQAYSNKKDCKGDIFVKKILCGNNEGYIYFKYLGEFKKPKILCLNPSITLEYYCCNQNRWINVNELDNLYINQDDYLRCKICSDDKLCNLFVVDEIC